MSLTSYRTAPPRVTIIHTLYTLSAPCRLLGPRLRGGAAAAKLASLTKPRGSYEPDELPDCSTPRHHQGCAIYAFAPGPVHPCPGSIFPHSNQRFSGFPETD